MTVTTAKIAQLKEQMAPVTLETFWKDFLKEEPADGLDQLQAKKTNVNPIGLPCLGVAQVSV